MLFALGCHGENQVIGKQYFVRQAAILFKFAKATKDPKISAALLDKAADLGLTLAYRVAAAYPRASGVPDPA